MNEPIDVGGEMDYREVQRTLQHVRRWRFHRLVKSLCRKEGPLLWWRAHLAWRRICQRHERSQALWLSAKR